jgi:hypothetical protein
MVSPKCHFRYPMKALIAILVCGFAFGLIRAQEPPQQAAAASTPDAPAADGATAAAPALTADSSTAVPEPYREDRYQTTWAKNPFLIKVAATVQTQASFAEDWELKGIMERGGVQTAILGSKKDPSQFKRVGPNPDAEGFQLIKASPSRNRKDAKVEVAKGGETATFTFSETPTMPQTPGGAPRPGIVPGQPAPRVALPNVPGKPNAAVGVPPQQTGAVPTAPPSAVQRRRVLIPSPVPSANP